MVKCLETEYDRQQYDEAPVDNVKWPITEKMIMDCLNEQLPSGEEGKYARMVKLDICTVTHLIMEYKSITFIDNLASMTALTKLQLCNNVINRIENLDALVNLKWLDLSFNCIRKMENLDAFRHLEVLDLHRNFITTIENMDNLLKIELFHISSNKLDNYENVKYLRRFVRLRSASFAGNPMSKNPSFMPFLIALVPQLTMVDYKLVPAHDREVANAKYRAYVDKLVNTDDKLIRRASVVEAEEQVEQLHKDAFVDGFQEDRFWYALYENDIDGKLILQMNETDEIRVMYQELFRSVTKTMFEKGMRFYEMRQKEKQAYDIAVSEELMIVQKSGNTLTEEFVEYGATTLKDIRFLVNLMEDYERKIQHGVIHELPAEFPEFETQLNVLTKEYVKKLHEVWTSLINNEIEYNENLEIVNALLDRSIREIFEDMGEQFRVQFENLKDLEQQLHEKLIEALIKNETISATEDEEEEEEAEEEEAEEEEEEVEEEEEEEGEDDEEEDEEEDSDKKDMVMEEEGQDVIMGRIQTSHDYHNFIIGDREQQVDKSLRDFQDNFSIELAMIEYQRNRSRLAEIAHFTDTHYRYLKETRTLLHTTKFIPNVRGDQECDEEDECEPLQWYEKLTKRLKVKDKKFKASMSSRVKRSTVTLPSTRSPSPIALSERSSFIL